MNPFTALGDLIWLVYSWTGSEPHVSLADIPYLMSYLGLGGAVHHASCSIGIALLSEDSADLEALMRASDTAMYAAKEQGRNTFQFYNDSFYERVHRRSLLERELRQAVARDELFLVYQPTVSLAAAKRAPCAPGVKEILIPGDNVLLRNRGDWRFEPEVVQRLLPDGVEVDTFDGALIHGSINGQFIWQFYPGDVGPDGLVDMDAAKIDASMFPQAVQTYTQYKGKRCALPMLADTYGLYYNKALFKKAGITAPPATSTAQSP